MDTLGDASDGVASAPNASKTAKVIAHRSVCRRTCTSHTRTPRGPYCPFAISADLDSASLQSETSPFDYQSRRGVHNANANLSLTSLILHAFGDSLSVSRPSQPTEPARQLPLPLDLPSPTKGSAGSEARHVTNPVGGQSAVPQMWIRHRLDGQLAQQ